MKEFEKGLKKLNKDNEALEKEEKSLVEKFLNYGHEVELLACDKFDEILQLQEALNKEIEETKLGFYIL